MGKVHRLLDLVELLENLSTELVGQTQKLELLAAILRTDLNVVYTCL